MSNSLDGLALIIKAAQFAAHKHRNQRRKDSDKTPYINHPIELARVLNEEGGVQDPVVLAAALLHDTIEDTEAILEELRKEFGAPVAEIVAEVTDDKSLDKAVRKRLQVAKAAHLSRAAGMVKLADKICNLRDIVASPPSDWSLKRKQEYFDWAKDVVDQLVDANPKLAQRFHEVYAQRPKLDP